MTSRMKFNMNYNHSYNLVNSNSLLKVWGKKSDNYDAWKRVSLPWWNT